MKKSEIVKYWRNVRALTLTLLDRFPPETFGYCPTPFVRSAAEQFEHIGAVEIYIRKGLVDNVLIPVPEVGIKDKDTLRQFLIAEHAKTSRALAALPEDRLFGYYDTKFGRVTGEGLVLVAIDEEIHHRGNLYIYLRLLEIEPPQMVHKYGEIFAEDTNG